MEITLWLPGPTPYRRQPDYQIVKTKGGRAFVNVYPNEKTKAGVAAWRKAWLASEERLQIDGPVLVRLASFIERPRTHFRADGVTLSPSGLRYPFPSAHAHGADLDNMAKIALDGLKGLALGDDCEVVRLSLSKRWAPAGEGGTRLRIRRAPAPDPHPGQISILDELLA